MSAGLRAAIIAVFELPPATRHTHHRATCTQRRRHQHHPPAAHSLTHTFNVVVSIVTDTPRVVGILLNEFKFHLNCKIDPLTIILLSEVMCIIGRDRTLVDVPNYSYVRNAHKL